MVRSFAPLLILLLFGNNSYAQREIPDDNLAYPVLIQLIGTSGVGSGFYFNIHSATYLVTAKHVLMDPATGKLRSTRAQLISYPGNSSLPGRNLIEADLSQLLQSGDLVPHQSQDVLVMRIGTTEIGPDSSSGSRPIHALKGITFKETAGIVGVGSDGVKTFDSVLISNDVIVFGYPTSIGLQQIPQIDSERPLLRRGIVAGQNLKTRSIIIDCPAYYGNSGGPVLQVEHQPFGAQFRVIGVVLQFVPFAETWANVTHGYVNTTLTNSGYTVVAPMDFVLELIK